MLEGNLSRNDRSATTAQTIAAFHKVYLISTSADEVTPSLIAEAELYEEMGRAFDPKYFQNAIRAYQFLLKQYPESRYRGECASLDREDSGRTICMRWKRRRLRSKSYLKQYPEIGQGRRREGSVEGNRRSTRKGEAKHR